MKNYAMFVKVNDEWRFEGLFEQYGPIVKMAKQECEKENGPNTFRLFDVEGRKHVVMN